MTVRPTLLAVAAVLLAALPGLAGHAAAQTRELDPADPAWHLSRDVEVGRWEGRPALLLRNGTAARPDIAFADGTIEFDLWGTDERAFLGVVFRRGPEGDAEDLYLRLHKSKLPDALQYTPDYRGRGQWQLYHGPAATAFATFTPGAWQRVRIEVRGDRAALFVGEGDEPRLVVDRLRTGAGQGHLGFWANQPGAGEDAPYTAALTNIRITPGVTRHAFAEPEAEPPPAGVIPEWGISRVFPREGPDVLELPPEVVEGPWRAAGTEESGLLPLEPRVERPEEGTPAVLAGLRLRVERPRTVRLDLGFSDDASVFLDGRLVYSGRHGFSPNFPRRQGLITLEQASLHLPLEAGEHQLIVAVSEAFGGWGIMGRIEDRSGLEVRPLTRP